jgi:hypothetical protein
VVLRVVHDVLADALGAAAAQADDGAHARERARHVALEPLEGVLVDGELEVLQTIPVGHGADPTAGPGLPGSARMGTTGEDGRGAA